MKNCVNKEASDHFIHGERNFKGSMVLPELAEE